MADENSPPEETSPSPVDPNPTEEKTDLNPEDDPHFVPADHPDFIPPPDEPKMDASVPTSRGLREFGDPADVDDEV